MRYAALILAALALAACNTFEDDAQRTNARATTFAFPAAFTTADARIITERKHPVTGQEVVCTEPSPDVAKAISTAFALSGQGSGGTGSGSGGVATSAGSAEAVAELAGRSTALLALRDGLFQACQAYANGAIGVETYALIISRYGQLMTTLFLGQDMSGVAKATATAQSPPISATATAAPGSSSGSPSATVTVPPPAAGAPGSAPAPTATPASGAANALVRMNEDYLNLDYNFIHLLEVVCVNAGDPTIMTPADPNKDNKVRQVNPWLAPVCNEMQEILTPAGLQGITTLAEGLAKNHILAAPVDPTSTTVTNITTPPPVAAKAATPKSNSPAPSVCPTPTAVQITEVQTTLMVEGYLDSKTPTGKLDSTTLAALKAAQPKFLPSDPCTTSNNSFGSTTLNAINALGPKAAAELGKEGEAPGAAQPPPGAANPPGANNPAGANPPGAANPPGHR